MSQFINQEIENIISRMSEHSDNKSLRRELDNYLFTHYCEKGYLSECEPEYCTYRYTNSCRYIKALHEIAEKFGINPKG